MGGAPDERSCSRGLKPADFRAFITDRRNEGLGMRGVRRAMSAVSSFFRYLAREGDSGKCGATARRKPRSRARLPRPLSEIDAAARSGRSDQNDVAWIAARDVALLTLLYGAGLRISEGLGLARGERRSANG